MDPAQRATTGIASHKSNFSSAVTLFTLDGPEMPASGSTSTAEPRRSPRKRVKVEYNEEVDMEDTIPECSSPKVSPLIALRNRLASQASTAGSTSGNTASPAKPGKRRSGKATVEVKAEIKEEPEIDSSIMIAPTKTIRTRKGKEKAELDECTEDISTPTDSPMPSTPSKRKGKQAATPRTPKAIPTSLATPHPPPENWEEVYGLIKEMRSSIVAPVDTMGCDQAQFRESEPRNRRFTTLVSLMLSSQTKDEVTDAAVTKLRAAVGGTLSIDNIINTDDSVIAEAIGKVGFWRRKTEYIKKTALQLRDKFNSDVPKSVDELCSLPGVGPKMAFLALQVAWDLNLGIGVDVHVHRITNRLGWHKRPTKTPEETRLNLQSWLPKEFHREINHMLVGFGQVRCLPIGPKCNECVLSTKGLCPSARVVGSTKATSGKKRKVLEVKVEDETIPSEPGVEEMVATPDSKIARVSLEDETLLKIEDGGVKLEEI